MANPLGMMAYKVKLLLCMVELMIWDWVVTRLRGPQATPVLTLPVEMWSQISSI
jgi:hypothetical protein